MMLKIFLCLFFPLVTLARTIDADAVRTSDGSVIYPFAVSAVVESAWDSTNNNKKVFPQFPWTSPTAIQTITAAAAGLPSNPDMINFSNTGLYMAVSVAGGTSTLIYSRNGSTFTLQSTLTGTTASGFASSAWAHDDSFLVIGSRSTGIDLYNISGGAFTRQLNNNHAIVNTGVGSTVQILSISPDDQFIGLGIAVTPFFQIYSRSGTVFSLTTVPATIPDVFANTVSFSPDMQFVAVAGNSNTAFYIYQRNGTTFTFVTKSGSDIPAGSQNVEWTPDSKYLVVGIQNASSIVVYQRNGTVFTRGPWPLSPLGTSSRRIAISRDGNYIAQGSQVTPFIAVQRRINSTLTRMSTPSTIPTATFGSQNQCLSWSYDGQYLGLANTTDGFTIYQTSSDIPENGVLIYPGKVRDGY